MEKHNSKQKELNKKLLKKTFLDELKNHKFNLLGFVIYFFVVFFGLCIGDFINGIIDVDIYALNRFIDVITIAILLFAAHFIPPFKNWI
ncbi:MAG: hypothetical protein IJO29_08640 [Oscillospiraceae bacterium]|nr:hypothetical protein [Oscillospiraceae bacterium]